MKRIVTILFLFAALAAAAQTRRSKVDYLQIRLEDAPATIGGSGTIFYDETDSLIKMRMTDGSIFIFGDTSNAGADYCAWDTLGNYIFEKDTAQNVGIGTNTPTSKLHVIGGDNLLYMGARFDSDTIDILSGKNINSSAIDATVISFVSGNEQAAVLIGRNSVGNKIAQLVYEEDGGRYSAVRAYLGAASMIANADAGIDVGLIMADPLGTIIQGKDSSLVNYALRVKPGNATFGAGTNLLAVRNDGLVTIGNATANAIFAPSVGFTATYLSAPDTVILSSSGFGFFSEVTDSFLWNKITNIPGEITLSTNNSGNANSGLVEIKLDGINGQIGASDGEGGVIEVPHALIAWDTTNTVEFTSYSEVIFNGTITVDYQTSPISNPPTDAELDALYGTPATAGDGFTAKVKDSDSNNFYEVVAVGGAWYTFTATLAP